MWSCTFKVTNCGTPKEKKKNLRNGLYSDDIMWYVNKPSHNFNSKWENQTRSPVLLLRLETEILVKNLRIEIASTFPANTVRPLFADSSISFPLNEKANQPRSPVFRLDTRRKKEAILQIVAESD